MKLSDLKRFIAPFGRDKRMTPEERRLENEKKFEEYERNWKHRYKDGEFHGMNRFEMCELRAEELKKLGIRGKK